MKQIRPGQKAKGTISLMEKRVKIDFPEIPGKKRGLEYTGVLFWKSDLPTQKISHLVDYMGTKKKPEGEMSKYCSFGYDDSGKVWRVHAMLNEYGENYKTDILGMASYVYFPDGMKEIEDGAIRGYTQCSYRLTSEGEKRGGYLKESEESQRGENAL